jgi:hypothetical protein
MSPPEVCARAAVDDNLRAPNGLVLPPLLPSLTAAAAAGRARAPNAGSSKPAAKSSAGAAAEADADEEVECCCFDATAAVASPSVPLSSIAAPAPPAARLLRARLSARDCNDDGAAGEWS